MKPPLMLTQDIVGIGEFKAHASAYLRRLKKTPGPLVITQHGRPAAVIMSPGEFDAHGYADFVRSKVVGSIASLRTGKTRTSSEVLARVRARAKARARAR